jgi:catechol 2,3-dioxygenase-like lactoylglutathione lyase family enzyme
MSVEVVGHDHVVFLVRDPEASLAWYTEKLGLRSEREDEWRAGEVPFLSIRVDSGTVIDLFAGEPDGRNVDHVSMRVADDVDLHAVAASGDFDVVSGPSWIWGAQGHGWGIYVCDPDGNIIELKHYGGDPPT